MKKKAILFIAVLSVLVFFTACDTVTAVEKIALAKEALTIPETVTEDIALPLSSEIEGVTIAWSSDKPEIISNTGVVTRPSFSAGNATVKLTATLTCGVHVDTKVFTVVVTKADQTAAEIANYKQSKIEALDDYASNKDEDYFSAADWASLQDAIDNGLAAIDSAETTAQADVAFLEAKSAIDAIAEIESVSIKSLAQVVYREGAEGLNFESLTIQLNKTDETAEEVAVTAEMLGAFVAETLDTIQTITITYNVQFSVNFDVLIISDEALAGLVRLEHDKWFFEGYTDEAEKFGEEFADFDGFNTLFDAAFNSAFNTAFDNRFDAEFDAVYGPLLAAEADALYAEEFANHWNATIASNFVDAEYAKEFNRLAALPVVIDAYCAAYPEDRGEYDEANGYREISLGDYVHSLMRSEDSEYYFMGTVLADLVANAEAAAHTATLTALDGAEGLNTLANTSLVNKGIRESTFDEVHAALHAELLDEMYDDVYQAEIAKYEELRTAICDWARTQLLSKTPAQLIELLSE